MKPDTEHRSSSGNKTKKKLTARSNGTDGSFTLDLGFLTQRTAESVSASAAKSPDLALLLCRINSTDRIQTKISITFGLIRLKLTTEQLNRTDLIKIEHSKGQQRPLNIVYRRSTAVFFSQIMPSQGKVVGAIENTNVDCSHNTFV